jgi:2-succinyl-5-enolpyruvyl-6-hydroxy-3-cyclohexene-1-carboxylate synthase
VNPATAFAEAVTDELIRCGVTEAVLAPGSRSAPLALAWLRRAAAGDLRLHVRIDERSAGFLALGLAKASRAPVPVLCTSGTAAAHLHAAVIEADEAGVPLLVLTADRPPELRGTGASQAIDQLKLYGSAVRWFAEAGVPEDPAARPAAAGYWRSLACRAWAVAAGTAGGFPGPVHLNLALRDPLVPADGSLGDPAGPGGGRGGGSAAGPGPGEWPAWLAGRPGGAPWTSFWPVAPAGEAAAADVDWAERGVLVCGDGDYPAGPLLRLAEAAGWPVLAEPSSGARTGPNALSSYSYLLADPGFAAAHRPEVIVSAGRPGLSRGQLAFLRAAAGQDGGRPARHIVVAQGPGRWADPGRSATAVVPGVRLRGGPGPGSPAAPASSWLAAWQQADAAVGAAVTAEVEDDGSVSEPWLARELTAALPDGALLWAASSMPVRDLDSHAAPRAGLRVLASRGASGIDGLVSASIGAALAHQAAGGGPAWALLGDLAFLHDAPGLMLGPDEPRPDLCLVVVNNNGGGIFATLEQGGLPAPAFERLFGTPHGASLAEIARAAGLPYTIIKTRTDLAAVGGGAGLRVAEAQTSRPAGTALRAAMTAAAGRALRALR